MLTVKPTSSESYIRFKLMEKGKVLVFHSGGSDIDPLNRLCPEYNFSHSIVPEFEKIFIINEFSVVPRGQHPGIDNNMLNEQKAASEKIDAELLEYRVALRDDALSYAQNFCEEGSILLEATERAIKTRFDMISKKKNCRRSLMGTVINKFLHTEPRILHYLSNDSSEFYIALRSVANSTKSGVDILLLNLHSTDSVCDDCRLQLPGAMHKWLYTKITDIFRLNDRIPIFDLVVTWVHAPHRPIHRTNKVQDRELNLDNVATSDSLCSTLSSATKPYVSIVRLRENKFGRINCHFRLHRAICFAHA